MSCPNCGMHVPDCPLIWEPGEDPYHVEGPVWHECPEPYSRETAEVLAQAIACGAGPVHPRMWARIQLGLRA